jgi:hypothetical protein
MYEGRAVRMVNRDRGGDMCGHAEVGRGLERFYVWVGLG